MQLSAAAPISVDPINQRVDSASNESRRASGAGNVQPDSPGSVSAEATELGPQDEQRRSELARRDREVRAHEQAHRSAAGAHARSGPTYQYEVGPDGKRYAVGGEVAIDVSPVPGSPEATISKMQQVRRAALAPANPSAADRQIAAEASQKQAEARREIQDSSQTQQPAASDAPARGVYSDSYSEPTGGLLSITV